MYDVLIDMIGYTGFIFFLGGFLMTEIPKLQPKNIGNIFSLPFPVFLKSFGLIMFFFCMLIRNLI